MDATVMHFEDFMSLFKEKVINGNFQKFGREATRETPDLKTGIIPRYWEFSYTNVFDFSTKLSQIRGELR